MRRTKSENESLSLWSSKEREEVEAVIEHECARLWAIEHEYDSLSAGRDWTEIQKYVKSRNRPKGGSIGGRLAKSYKDEIKHKRQLVSYLVETGWIAREQFDEGD